MMNLQAANPTSGRAQQAPRHVYWLALANALALCALWLFETRVGEASWLSGLLCYIPQHLVPLPTLLLLLLCLRQKLAKPAALYALTLLYATHIFLGLQAPASTWARAFSPGTSRTRNSLRLRAMTYNILGGQRGLENIASAVREQDPDVLFLQEAVVEREGDPDPVIGLRPLLSGYREAREGEVCILSRFPILASASHQFPDGAARYVLEAVLDVRGVPVRVVTAHPYTITFRSEKYPFPERIRRSLGIRNAQISTLLGVLASPPSTWKREWREAPLLVAGDFNTPPRGRVYDALASRLGDSWREAGWGFGNTYSARWPLVRIDYVWHSAQWSAARAFVPGGQASDHRPLVVDLEAR